MDDTPHNDEAAPSGRNLWWMGGAVAVAAIGGAFLLSWNAVDPSWGKQEPVIEKPRAVAEKAAPAVEAAEKRLEVRGVVKAQNEATLGSRMTARIIEMPYKVGASFGRGAVLARFDCSQIRAQLKAAEAAATAYRKTYDTNVELDQYEAVGTNEVEVSKANLGKAQAEAAATRAQLGDCQVFAPFGGTVVEKIANTGEVAASGQPMIKIQSGGALEAELIVPSSWLTWLAPGARFDYTLDETGERIAGTIKRLGASVDPVSKTIRVTGDLTPGAGLVLPGMSGTAHFEGAPKPGPASAAAASAETKSDVRPKA